MSDTASILADRGPRYGPWPEMSACAQSIKTAMASASQWDNLPPGEREALEMIATKIARAVCGRGDPDNYADIAGYAALAESSCVVR